MNPSDEWLKIETGSIVESLGSAINPDGSLVSDYSILDNAHAEALNVGVKLIKTKIDIFVEDETMLKIINYITMFTDDVYQYLSALRSASTLL